MIWVIRRVSIVGGDILFLNYISVSEYYKFFRVIYFVGSDFYLYYLVWFYFC